MAKVLQGTVSSDRPNKTIVVTVVTHKSHPLYKKRYISSKKVMAHDENNKAKTGDKVTIIETKPISANKHFRLLEVVERPVINEKISSSQETETQK